MPVLHKFHFSLFDGDVPCPTSVTLLSVWWRCALSYTSYTYHCLMEMCPVLHQLYFSVFDGDVPCPSQVPLLIVWWRCALSYISSTSHCLMEMCPVLHQLYFSVFDGDVPCPSQVPLLSIPVYFQYSCLRMTDSIVVIILVIKIIDGKCKLTCHLLYFMIYLPFCRNYFNCLWSI